MDCANSDPASHLELDASAMSATHGRRSAALAAAFVAFLLHGSASLAQDLSKIRAGLDTWQSSGCADCHGPFADGNRDDDDYPQGANLRTTRLGVADIEMTIRCGRPGTGMPSFDPGAYTDRACYGRPLGARPTIFSRRLGL